MAVIRRYERNAGLIGKIHQCGVYDVLFGNPVLLEIKIKIPASKDAVVKQGGFLRLLRFMGQDRLRNLSAQAGAQTDQPFRVLLQNGMVHSRFIIESFHITA